MQAKMKLPLVFPVPRREDREPQVLFRAWIRAPMCLNAGDEIEIDLPGELLSDTTAEQKPRTIRATGRIANLAVHADGRLWYEFAAASTCEITLLRDETILKYPSLSIIP